MDNQEYIERELQKNRDFWHNADSDEEEIDDIVDSDDDSRYTTKFIIQLVNGSLGGKPSVAVSDVDLGDAVTNRTASNFGQNGAITITSTIQGVTYLEFLAQSESQPFVVGKTMIVSTSPGQLELPMTLTHRNASGDRLDKLISPTLDPYQYQTDRVIDDTEYMFDGYSRLRFSQINANATVTVKMYLLHAFSTTQLVAGRDPILKYKVPPTPLRAANK